MKPRYFLFFLLVFSGIFPVAEAGEIRYDSAGRRDPFVPLMGLEALRSGTQGDSLSIEGIIYDPKGDSYAVIAGEAYKEGEDVEGVKLVRILPDRVIFLQGSQEVVSWLREEIMQEGEKSER